MAKKSKLNILALSCTNNVTARWTATPKHRQYNEKQGMNK